MEPITKETTTKRSATIELTTQRLLLRRYVPEDAEILHRDFGLDPAMFEYSGWNPYATKEMAEKTVADFISSYGDDHFYGWVIEHGGRLIGTIGAYDYDPESNTIEIGASIRRADWGKGYGGEAAKAVIDHLISDECISCVKAWCAADNKGSAKIMERAGMRLVSTEKDDLEIGGEKYDKLNYEIRISG